MRTSAPRRPTLSEEQKAPPAERAWVALGAAFGLLAVVAGAAGTHVLRGSLSAEDADIFQTAVRFQMYHGLALLAVGLLAGRWRSRLLTACGWLFALGIVCFSGSLYGIALTDLGFFAVPAPVGGVALMAAWAFLALGAVRRYTS